MYVQNADGSTAIKLNGITSSPIPVWATNSTLPSGDVDTAFSISLSAPSDSSVNYYLANGSSLPAGTTLASNGLFSGTVTGISDETTYNFSVNAIDAENQETLRSFSVTIVVGDPYYYNTVLHINGERVSNNWITDASSNAFAITVNGDTRPVAFSPYETVWSNFFDGTGDYLQVGSTNAPLSWLNSAGATGTIEAWVMPTLNRAGSLSYTHPCVIGIGGTYMNFGIANGTPRFFWWTGTVNTLDSSIPVTLNSWNHLALVFSGSGSNNVRIYVNGQLGATGTFTNIAWATADGGNNVYVGVEFSNTTTSAFPGYISNLRVLKGTALYTSAFTPPTSPLTAIANTSLLTCQSNRLIDNSTNNFTITKNGDVTVSNFGPFVETDLVTGSGYFDGTGDYLRVPYSNPAFSFGTSDLTIECWIYQNGAENTITSVIGQGQSSGTAGQSIGLFKVAAGTIGFYAAASTGAYGVNIQGNVPSNAWTHVAGTRNGNTWTLWINGVSAGTATWAGTLTQEASGSYGGIDIGHLVGSYVYKGYISNARVIKGTALYTAAFTPPTSPLTAITNTSLLTLQSRIGENNNRFVDNSGIDSIITRNGNTTQGTFNPFEQNSWSNYFDGIDDYFSIPDNVNLQLGSGNFTAEGWFYPFHTKTGSVNAFYTKGVNTTGGIIFGVSSDFIFCRHTTTTDLVHSSGTAANSDKWIHVAWVRDGNQLTIYRNGANVASSSVSFNQNDNSIAYFGSVPSVASTTNRYGGYVSNFRIVKGTAVYTSAFTPSTSPLTAIANTSLLTCHNRGFKDSSTNAFTLTTVGDVSVQNFSPFKPSNSWSESLFGGSVYFDGNGDWLNLGNISALALGTGDFTWELWIYLDISTLPSFAGIYDQRNGTNGVSVIQPVVELTSTNGYAWYVAAGNRITSGTAAVKMRSWQHLAICRSSGVTKMFIDGVQVGSNYTDTNNYPSGTITIGRENDGVSTRYLTGYLSGLRVIRGQALYTANTTPPTTPPTPIVGTTLLLNYTEGGIINYASRENIETVGDARLRNNITKYGNNSIFFDGTGDYLLMPSGPDLDFGTGNFTIEMWINFTNATSAWQAIISRAYGVAGGWRLYKNNNDNQLRWYHNTTSIVLTTNSDIASGVWSHIAAVRNNGTLTLYINGTNRGSASDTNSYNPGTYALEIGSGVVTSAYPMTGYIDDLRITKGVARYTANFTPPTAAFKTK